MAMLYSSWPRRFRCQSASLMTATATATTGKECFGGGSEDEERIGSIFFSADEEDTSNKAGEADEEETKAIAEILLSLHKPAITPPIPQWGWSWGCKRPRKSSSSSPPPPSPQAIRLSPKSTLDIVAPLSKPPRKPLIVKFKLSNTNKRKHPEEGKEQIDPNIIIKKPKMESSCC